MTRARLLGVVLAGAVLPGAAEEIARPPALEGVGIEQHLDAQVPLDLRFRDETGRSVALGELIEGKPTILNLVYYECPMLCTLVVNGLVASMRTLPFEAGREFRVITVSIDPRETPELAAAKKKNVLAAYGRPAAGSGWHFLTGDEEAVRKLAATVGFGYRYDAKSDTFAHASGILVLTPRGKVSRYFYGVEYAPRNLRLALIEASENKIGSLADQVILFCYHYDPATGRYGVAALRLVRLGGVLTVLALATYVWIARRRETARSA